MSLDREWEEFTGGPNIQYQDRIHITINKTGLFHINGNAHRMLGRLEAVKLFFNKSKETIAIKPAHARLAGVFPVKEKDGYYRIHAAPFCRHFGICLSTTEKFVRPTSTTKASSTSTCVQRSRLPTDCARSGDDHPIGIAVVFAASPERFNPPKIKGIIAASSTPFSCGRRN